MITRDGERSSINVFVMVGHNGNAVYRESNEVCALDRHRDGIAEEDFAVRNFGFADFRGDAFGERDCTR